MNPYAYIRYLVGYRASNLFYIWILALYQVVIARDVIFDERTFFNTTNESTESLQVSEYIPPREVISILDIELLNQFLLEFEDTFAKSTEPETEPVTDTGDPITSGVGELEVKDQSKLQDQDPTQEPEPELPSPSPLGILTPESIPEPSVIA